MHREKKPVSTTVRVRYADTDRMGVAYYAAYLIWFEVGRTEFMRALGYPYRQCEAEGVILPVISASANYLKPARYDDQLRIETWVSNLAKVRVAFSYEVFNHEDSTLLATGLTEHAAVSAAGRPVRIPAAVRRLLGDEE